MSQKEEIYKKAGLGGSLGFGKRPAIVVVDFQKGFTLPESPAGGDMTNPVLQTVRITEAAKKKNIKVFYTRVGYNQDGTDLATWGFKTMVLRSFVRDHWYYEFDDRLRIDKDDVIIEKHWPSAFFGTHLVQMLIPMHIDTVVVSGCTTAGCVYATVVDSCSYGFRTIVVPDSIADRSEETHNVFLWNMGQKYAEIIHADQVIEEISKLEPLTYDLLNPQV